MAFHLLLTHGSSQSVDAYLSYLAPHQPPAILLPALSALLDPNAAEFPILAGQKLKSALKSLIFHTKSPLIRTKASQVYEKLYSRQ